MKKRLFILLTTLFLALSLVACNSGYNGKNNDTDSSGEGGGLENSEINNQSERKIIYRVNISLKAENLSKTTGEIKALLENDEWVEGERVTTNTNHITLRIKSSRLSSFTNKLKGDYETTNYEMTSTDVSLDYLNTNAIKESLENELDRLNQLYTEASVYDMISISQRISQVDAQLRQIERKLNEYDSLVDYSVVTIWIYGPKGSPNPPSYGTKLSNAFKLGWTSVKAIFSFFSQAVVFLVPFLIIVVPISGAAIGIYFYSKKRKK